MNLFGKLFPPFTESWSLQLVDGLNPEHIAISGPKGKFIAHAIIKKKKTKKFNPRNFLDHLANAALVAHRGIRNTFKILSLSKKRNLGFISAK